MCMSNYVVAIELLNPGECEVTHIRRGIHISDLGVVVSLQDDRGSRQTISLSGLAGMFRDCPCCSDDGFHLGHDARRTLDDAFVSVGVGTPTRAVRECEAALSRLMKSIFMLRTLAL